MSNRPKIDPCRSAPLPGPRNLTAVVAVAADGTDRLWLLTGDGGPDGCACPDCAPHEQNNGRLVLRCRAPRTDGRPCLRESVGRCWQHRQPAPRRRAGQ